MACSCGKNNITNTMKSNLRWSINRAKIIAKLRQEDVQVYQEGDLYEIEFPLNKNRKNIIEIIKWQELE